MRIISGKAGGITLSVPKGEVRPTTDRVREAVFSILNPLMDRADVLDLFAGSGAFGLEALSRGARDARMVDFSRLSCAAARANLVKTGLEGGTVIQGDAVQFVRRELLAGRKYDIIFADPPYFLSNDGITCSNGKMVSVNKGEWDKSKGFNEDVKFHKKWL